MIETAARAFTRLASGVYLEGLAVDHARDLIWYSDVIAGGVHGVRPDGTPVASLDPDRRWTGGLLVNGDGAVLATGEGGIKWLDPDSGQSGWLLDAIDGKPIAGINEMVPDGRGGIFFGTIDMERVIAGEEPRPVAIYRLTAEREVVLLADGIGFTNGLMYDAQRARFYCNDTFRRAWAFDVGPDLMLSNQRSVCEKEDVDGMTLDAEGNLWITGFRSGHVERIAPDGTVLPRFATPAGAITQLRFGGADMRDIYFTAVPSDGGDTLKEGGEITEANSHLYHCRSDIAGTKFAPPTFRLV
ncbi:gluconolactonase [Novosphingobium sp. PC22D]|uniref:SMP-30/gluconolactonase/LRE family protein n=1 Tax=Novosphingobium sp. PC22D TaxID=1962403 RepID=UPI000BF1187F|nr:SMP-30/gluconolactonase/LRE family protein [Novosphingobium sp. PC22D]PEQ11895.1 gluconolactonase [Novosphingobium sp. PC22D]